jgi:hypothetical protein
MNTTKFHRAIFATIALFLLPICAAAQINFNATWYFTDFVGANMGVRQVQIDPLLTYSFNGTNIVTGDSHTYPATNSWLTVSNMLAGSYRVTFRGLSVNTVFTNNFPYGTTGNIIASTTNYFAGGYVSGQGWNVYIPSLNNFILGDSVSNGMPAQVFSFTNSPASWTNTLGIGSIEAKWDGIILTNVSKNGGAPIANNWYSQVRTNEWLTWNFGGGVLRLEVLPDSSASVIAGATNGLPTTNYVITSIQSALATATNSFYAQSNPSNFVVTTALNSASNYLQSLIVTTTNGITAVTATNIANASSAAALIIATNYANTNSIALILTSAIAGTNYTTSVSNLVYANVTNFVNAGILSATNNVLTLSSNSFYRTGNPSNFVVLSTLNSASNALYLAIGTTTNGITAVFATNIVNAAVNSSSNALFGTVTNYANTNSLAQGASSTNYTTSVSNLVYINATNSAGSIAGNVAYNATNNFVGTMNAAILSATNAFTNKVNALILTATNAIGTASGLAAFQNTNFFDLAGAGTAAALASTNGLPTMAFASTNQFIRTNTLPALTNVFAATNYVIAATNNFGTTVAVNMTNAANQIALSQLTIGGSTLVYITNILNNTNTILAGGTLAGSYFYSPYTNAYNGSYVSSANGSHSLTNNAGMFTASGSLTNIYSLVSSNWILGGTPLTTTAYTYYALVTNYPVVINTAIITNGVYSGDGSGLTNITVTASSTNIIINNGGVGTNLTVYGTLTSTNLTAVVNAAALAATNNLGNTIPTLMTNAANQFTGIFSGNGSGLSGTTATATNAIGNLNGTGTNATIYGTLTSTNLTAYVLTTNFTIPNYRTNFSVTLPTTTNSLIGEGLSLVAIENNPYGLLMLSNNAISTKYVAGQSYAGCPPFSQASPDGGITWSIIYTGDNSISFADTNGSPTTFTAIQLTNAFKLQARYSWVKHQ